MRKYFNKTGAMLILCLLTASLVSTSAIAQEGPIKEGKSKKKSKTTQAEYELMETEVLASIEADLQKLDSISLRLDTLEGRIDSLDSYINNVNSKLHTKISEVAVLRESLYHSQKEFAEQVESYEKKNRQLQWINRQKVKRSKTVRYRTRYIIIKKVDRWVLIGNIVVGGLVYTGFMRK